MHRKPNSPKSVSNVSDTLKETSSSKGYESEPSDNEVKLSNPTHAQTEHADPVKSQNQETLSQFLSFLNDTTHQPLKDLKTTLSKIPLELDRDGFKAQMREAVVAVYAKAYIVERQKGGITSGWGTKKGEGVLKILDDAITNFNKKTDESIFNRNPDWIPDNKKKKTDYQIFASVNDNEKIIGKVFDEAINALQNRNRAYFINSMKIIARTGKEGQSVWDRLVNQNFGQDIQSLYSHNMKDSDSENWLNDTLYPSLINNKVLTTTIADHFIKQGHEMARQAQAQIKASKSEEKISSSPRPKK